MPMNEFQADLDLAPLSGATVDAYAQDEGYWHLFVALRLVGGEPFVFTTKDHMAGPRFEVFPIRAGSEPGTVHAWRALAHPFVIARAVPLWRVEWMEPGARGPTLGADAATHYAGRGPATPEASASARIRAGVLLEGESGERMIVAASDSAPFNVEVFVGDEVGRALERFERLNP